MSETKFTKGEWKATYDMDGDFIICADDTTLAGVGDYGGTSKVEDEANAHLIAAAPDLYASVSEFLAMRQAVIDVGGAQGPLDQQLIDKFAEMQIGVVHRARAALRRSRGESQ
jgi:hypothetical protein